MGCAGKDVAGITGAIAQLVERVLCKHEVVGSIPSGSTTIPLLAIEEIIHSRPAHARRV